MNLGSIMCQIDRGGGNLTALSCNGWSWGHHVLICLVIIKWHSSWGYWNGDVISMPHEVKPVGFFFPDLQDSSTRSGAQRVYWDCHDAHQSSVCGGWKSKESKITAFGNSLSKCSELVAVIQRKNVGLYINMTFEAITEYLDFMGEACRPDLQACSGALRTGSSCFARAA